MSNTIADGAMRQLWMQGVQDDLNKKLVAKGIGAVDTRAARIFHNPFNSTPVGTNGTKQSTYTTENMTSTDDTLTVQQRATIAEQIDSYEQMMTSYDLMSQQAQRQAYRLADYIDQFVLNMPVSKSGIRQIDNGIIGGGASDSAGYVLSSTNANTAANTLAEYLALGNAALEEGLFWVISPYDMTKITAYAHSHGFNLSDSAISAGYLGSAGKQFSGMDLFVSNNLTHTTNLTLATNPTAGDTLSLTVNGRTVKFTFRASPSVAGDVKIGGSAAATQATLVLAINGTGVGDGTDYTELAQLDRWTLQQASPQSAPGTYAMIATFATNVGAITVYGSLAVTKSLTAGGDGFSTVIRHTIAGVKGSMFLALPSDGMTYKAIDVSGKHGKEVSTAQVYDATIWNNDKIEVLNVLIS
jgi:hypothetical protein